MKFMHHLNSIRQYDTGSSSSLLRSISLLEKPTYGRWLFLDILETRKVEIVLHRKHTAKLRKEGNAVPGKLKFGHPRKFATYPLSKFTDHGISFKFWKCILSERYFRLEYQPLTFVSHLISIPSRRNAQPVAWGSCPFKDFKLCSWLLLFNAATTRSSDSSAQLSQVQKIPKRLFTLSWHSDTPDRNLESLSNSTYPSRKAKHIKQTCCQLIPCSPPFP